MVCVFSLKSLLLAFANREICLLTTWNLLPSKLLGRSRVHSQNRQPGVCGSKMLLRPQLLAMDNIGDTVSDHKFHVESNSGAISGSAAA